MNAIKKELFLLLYFLLVISFKPIFGQTKTIVSSLKCEFKENPIGIESRYPRFSWEMNCFQRNVSQTAYRILVADSPDKLQRGEGNLWDTKKVKRNLSIQIQYLGKELESVKKYYWKVMIWDDKDNMSSWSEPGMWQMGLLSPKDWCAANWIAYEELPDSLRIIPGIHGNGDSILGTGKDILPLLRKEFVLKKPVKYATMFISGLGHFEMSLNGKKVGDHFLDPGWTKYNKNALYVTFDVTDQIKQGSNAIGVMLGNGFYYIPRERYRKFTGAYGYPKMMCNLVINYQDGTTENIISDTSWKTSKGPITYSSIYGGEDYNANLEQTGWDAPLFNDENWKAIKLVNGPSELKSQISEPLKILEIFSVKKITNPKLGLWVYDFAQNASGIIQLKVKGEKGQTIKLIPAELLNKQQLANQSATGEPYYFSYTLKGEGEEIWQPKFTYYGFRYVQIVGAVPDTANNKSGLPVINELKALHNRNSNPVNGSFECSNELFNRIYSLINWAIKSNMQSVITDCPHREKLSWLEQDYLMGASIHYNYDIYNLYRKLVFDLIDAQHPSGFVPDIAPEYVKFWDGFLDSPEWGSSSVILPWLLYKWYGDKDIVQSAYPMMKKYVAYLESKSDDHILSYGLGDWFDYGPNQPGEAQLTPKAITATSIYYYDVVLLEKMAEVLNNKADVLALSQLAKKIKRSFNNKFFNVSTKVYSTGSQTAMAMPLCVGLVDSLYKDVVLKNLVDSIYANNKALTAGDIGFHFLIKALDDGGKSQLIYDMNNRDDVPGYGFQLRKGATTLTESWPALENVSNNHLMLGHIMEWFFSGLAGISQDENSIGFKNIKIRPQPIGDITWAKGSFHSPYGWIKTHWEKANNKFLLQISIPVNTTATVYIPTTAISKITMNGAIISGNKIKIKDGVAVIETGSGEYNFEVENKQ